MRTTARPNRALSFKAPCPMGKTATKYFGRASNHKSMAGVNHDVLHHSPVKTVVPSAKYNSNFIHRGASLLTASIYPTPFLPLRGNIHQEPHGQDCDSQSHKDLEKGGVQ